MIFFQKFLGREGGQHDQHFVKNKFVKNRVGGRGVNLDLDNVFRYTVFFLTAPLMFSDMFRPYSNTCLHDIWGHVNIHVYIVFQTCLQYILRHPYNIFKNLFAECWKTCIYPIWRHVYTEFVEMFTKCSETCLHPVWNMFTQF